jgi:hypothetical protein
MSFSNITVTLFVLKEYSLRFKNHLLYKSLIEIMGGGEGGGEGVALSGPKI